MLPQEIIARKRDGGSLSAEEIADFISGVTDGSISDSQIAAFAMAVFLNGMSREEVVALTLAMRDSGEVLHWQGLNGPAVDKHSTGGVGDNVSLMLAPAVAACGAYVPMISGRGLGHTGGTLDKFDSIPGYNTTPGNALFAETVRRAGCAIIGQTGQLAPADRRIYAVRDVTATVESLPLITASILSKKLAAGLDALVLDVKCGSGAFMRSQEQARKLAQSLVTTANAAGLPTTALITDMDRPLASAAGNALEMANAVDFLTGRQVDQRLHRIVIALGREMLLGGGLADSIGEAERKVAEAISSGRAAERFAQMVSMLGGPADILENASRYLPAAPVVHELMADSPVREEYAGRLGYDARQLGLAVVELGGGRMRAEQKIDHAVGLSAIAEREWDGTGPICIIHARDDGSLERARRRILAALRVSPDPVPPILERVA